MITIIAVGKKHESWVHEGVERYEKRLRAPWNVDWVILPHSAREGQEARQEESERIIKHLKPDDIIVLLDERGKNLTSPALSQFLSDNLNQSKRIVLVIGGAYGVTDDFRQKATSVWSLSGLVFPHQLVRLIAVEQIYRAQEIAFGRNYHHN